MIPIATDRPALQNTDVEFLFNLFTDAGIAIRGQRWERVAAAYTALDIETRKTVKIVKVRDSYTPNRFAQAERNKGRCARIGSTGHHVGDKPLQYWLVWERKE